VSNFPISKFNNCYLKFQLHLLFKNKRNRASTLVQTLNAQNLNINSAYNMPSTDGATNQVLSTNGSGALSWVNQTGGSSVTLQGSSGQILVNEPTPNNYVIGFPAIVDMPRLVASTLNINSAYDMPTSIGLENQVLSVGSTNTLVWSSGGGTSGVNSITSTDPNVIIAGTATNPTVGLLL
jgi:hypothetical protein